MGNKKNQKIRKKMIEKYGEKCFIEELHLRDKKDIEKEFKLYGKKQRKIMDELTYHHIVEKCKGGATTEENGAILRNINHRWFNRLPKEKQAEINELFREYKKNYKENIKKPFEMFSEDELPKYHQITFCEILNKERELFNNEEYKKYILEKRKKQYKKFNVELVDELDTGVEIAFTDFAYDTKEKDKYNRAKKKQEDRKEIEKGYFKWEDER